MKKSTLEEFLSKLTTDQLEKYDYSKSVYTNSTTKMEILCRTCGKFFYQIPYDHKTGHGCRICAGNKVSDKLHGNLDLYIDKFNKIWGDTYTYENAVYLGYNKKLEITCKIHGPFWRTPCHHIGGGGCQQCVKERGSPRRVSQESFISKASVASGLNTDLSTVKYIDCRTYITPTCTLHGKYDQIPSNFLAKKQGCKKCSNSSISSGEKALVQFIESLGLSTIINDRVILKGLELDLVIPSKSIAIEYNGLYWHSEALKVDKNYHLSKTINCEKAGYRLIHIFEDEWIYNADIVKSKLKHILGLTVNRKLSARKLSIARITSTETERFLASTHIQGPGKNATHSYGLLDGNELVACMTFCPERFKKTDNMELLRFSSKYSIRGGFSKLLTAFIRDTGFTGSVVSFSDKRWSVGNVYKVNGFKLEGTSRPGYDYVSGKANRFNRQTFMKHKLPDLLPKFDPALTEVENCRNNGYYRIWNCGMDKWVLKV